MPEPMIPGAVGVGQKNDPAGTDVAPYLHGPAGLLNRRDIENPLISAVILPVGGVLDNIPVYNAGASSDNQFGGEDAVFDTLVTGVTSGNADLFAQQPTGECADGPVGGLLKLCKIANTFGRFRIGVREVSIVRAGRRAAISDPLGLRVLNSPALQGIFGVAGNTPTMNNAIGNEWASRLYESAVSFRRMFSQRVWIGSPANNSGQRRDIVGLDIHINAGNKVDADQSAICTAADSDVKNFGFSMVHGNAFNRDIVAYIEMAMDFALHNADTMGLSPIDGFIAMRPELWREICNVWPVRQYQHALNQIAQFSAGGRVMVNATDAQTIRNQMLETKLLPIKGRMWRVVTDDGIAELNVTTAAQLAAGQYASDIYFVPLTIMGGFPVTFFEYFNHANEQAQVLQNIAGQLTFTTDGGLFRWYINFKNGCLNATYELSPRLRMRAPQIAWRIQNVGYQPLQHFRSPYPGNTYFADGGVSQGEAAPQFYTEWSTTTPTAL